MENLYEKKDGILYEVYRFEADEMCSFVGKKEDKQWIWLVMNTANRQIIGFHVGGRRQEDAKKLFEQIPAVFKTNGVFFTDFWNGYHILEEERHIAASITSLTLPNLNTTLLIFSNLLTPHYKLYINTNHFRT